MRYRILPLFALCAVLLTVYASWGQTQGKKQSKVRIDNADLISNNEDMAPGVQVLTGNVRFYHGNTLMTCDKAEYNRGENTFFASGNVHVNEGDTLTLDSDYMHYTGDEQLIKAYGNVVLVNKTTTLRTDTLDYERQTQKAYYFNGATITDDKNTLKSVIGIYYVADDVVDFFIDVDAQSPDYRMYSDTMHYHTVTKVIEVEGPTNIIGEQNHIYTELGTYDTRTEISDFYKNSKIIYDNRMLRADTIHYDRFAGYARATANVEMQDTLRRVAVFGDRAEYFELRDSVIIPLNPKAAYIMQGDTLYMRSDTMMVTPRPAAKSAIAEKEEKQDSFSSQKGNEAFKRAAAGLGVPVPPSDTLGTQAVDTLRSMSADTLSPNGKTAGATAIPSPFAVEKTDTLPQLTAKSGEPVGDTATSGSSLAWQKEDADIPGLGDANAQTRLYTGSDTLKRDDSLRVLRAFRNVKYYKKDLSGLCDSVFYDQHTGVMDMFGTPVIFSDHNQITADTITLKRDMAHEVMDSVLLRSNAFIIARDEKDRNAYNQIKGTVMKGKIIDDDLRIVNIIGNAETIYYSYNDKNVRIGINRSLASLMKVFLKESRIQGIWFLKSPSGVLGDETDMVEETKRLRGFNLRFDERPLGPPDIWGGEVHLKLNY